MDEMGRTPLELFLLQRPVISKLSRFLALALVAASGSFSSAQFLPSLVVEDTVIEDLAACSSLVDEINKAMSETYQVPLFVRGYVPISRSGKWSSGFLLFPAGSFEALLRGEKDFMADDSLADARDRLESLATPGNRSYLKAIRFDGTNTPGWLLNVFVAAETESGLLEQVQLGLDALDLNDEQLPKVNVFRVVAGRTDATHLVSFNFESRIALGIGLDAIARGAWSLESGDCEIVVSETYRELGL